MDKWIVVSGNPVDGFTFHGPFDGDGIAESWADHFLDDEEYWLAKVYAPTNL